MTRLQTLAELATEERRRTAIHEAGHAAVLYAFQIPALCGIVLGSKEDFELDRLTVDADPIAGHIILHHELTLIRCSLTHYSNSQTNAYLLFDIILSMAGPLAESKYSGQADLEYTDGQWLQSMQDCYECLDTGYRDDYEKALDSATRLVGNDTRQIYRVICKGARLAEELFSDPTMEMAVRSLAEELFLSSEYYTAPEKCWCALEAGWSSARHPAYERKWRRRLGALYSIPAIQSFHNHAQQSHQPQRALPFRV